jgi:hypothetical protein
MPHLIQQSGQLSSGGRRAWKGGKEQNGIERRKIEH